MNHMRKFLFALVLLCPFIALASESDGNAVRCFPTAINGFETVLTPDAQAVALKTYRNTHSAGYNAMPYHTAITLFIYDRDPSTNDLAELKAAISEVLSSHSNAELVMSGKGQVRVAGTSVEAQGGLFLWSEGETNYGSFLWLVPGDKQYLKMRATYVRPLEEKQVTKAMQFAIDAIATVGDKVCRPQ
ncbi:hypothetical protein F990_02507 [Acinetobacter tjernbergiae DSM 14971 = CIP 107465]|uniref:Uncharacterized protein n=2 Tax=Acinetobacter tjernbergiae TaxID=202955 RepID=V2W3Q9_9GAMM|nr:hypothetical protein F990_02507 [Acinetobacter tjernbergiae DSM 14971 = CIP 107465]